MDVAVNDVSDPLKHLFSLDISRTSPLLNEINLHEVAGSNTIPKRIKKVRFADPFEVQSTSGQTNLNISKVKGILKKSAFSNEDNYSSINLNIYDSLKDYDYESSSFMDESSVEEDISYEDDMEQFDDAQSEELNENSLEESKLLSKTENDDQIYISEDLSEVDNRTNNLEVTTFGSNEQDSVIYVKSEIPSDVTVTDTFLQKPNNHILNVLSQIKAKSDKDIAKSVYRNPIPSYIRKPKPHFCVASSYEGNTDSEIYNDFYYKDDSCNSKYDEIKETLIIDKLKNCSLHDKKHLTKHFVSQQTTKLLSLLKENVTTDSFSSKELRSVVFNAWCKVKKENLVTSTFTPKFHDKIKERQKIIRSSTFRRGYLYWKKKHEIHSKIRKPSSSLSKSKSKLQSPILSEEEKRKKIEEKIQIYNSWKQKKDEQLRLKLQKERRNARLNRVNLLKKEEMKKKDAVSAFNAWKMIKLDEEIKHQEKIKEHEQEIDELKLKEKMERDKEAQEAYFVWLQKKIKSNRKRLKISNDRPPWNPPG